MPLHQALWQQKKLALLVTALWQQTGTVGHGTQLAVSTHASPLL